MLCKMKHVDCARVEAGGQVAFGGGEARGGRCGRLGSRFGGREQLGAVREDVGLELFDHLFCVGVVVVGK